MPKYVTNSTQFGNVTNRAQVDKAAQEGRIIPPLVEYLPKGSVVELPDDEYTNKLVQSGSIEKPGASQKAELEVNDDRRAELQRQIDALDEADKQAKKAAKQASKSGDVKLSGEELDARAQELGIDITTGGSNSDGSLSADEKRDAVAKAEASQGS